MTLFDLGPIKKSFNIYAEVLTIFKFVAKLLNYTICSKIYIFITFLESFFADNIVVL